MDSCRTTWAERALGVMDPIPEDAIAMLQAFWRFLLCHLCFRDVIAAVQTGETFQVCFALAFAGALVAAVRGIYSKTCRVVVGLTMAVKVALVFPDGANHFYLEFVLAGAFLVTDMRSRTQQQSLLRAVRWLCLFVFLGAAFQKVTYGTYFSGAFLAFYCVVERFSWFVELVTSKEEFAQLQRMVLMGADGPYRLRGLGARLISNAVWIAELSAAALMISRRGRLLGVYVAVGVLLGIQVVAREVLFGMLTLNMLALFMKSSVHTKSVAYASIAVYPLLVAVQVLFGAAGRAFN